jgi:predicted ATP-grasp superfamily ATP-dependent carboligase
VAATRFRLRSAGEQATARGGPLAYVLGGATLVRPLSRSGVRCVVVSSPGEPAWRPRFAVAAVQWGRSSDEPEQLVEQLVEFGRRQSEPPVLFYEADFELLVVSRFREQLAQAFRFAIADEALVEDLIDKARFWELAERKGLPVPLTWRLSRGWGAGTPDANVAFPLIVKPLTRSAASWGPIAGTHKALEVGTLDELRALSERLAAAGVDAVAQELIPGPEERIESYHVYVDGQGQIAGEFTGQKIRTYPLAYGHSSAVVITDRPDVAALGRELTRKLGLRGVAKFDFKRAPDGRLYLLEVNPRFSLWHYPGAVAGVNLPALVYADVAGVPRPRISPVRAGVTWCNLADDLRAARAAGIPLLAWLRWARSCEARGSFLGLWRHLLLERGQTAHTNTDAGGSRARVARPSLEAP